jgi:hypothetical protein
MGTLERLAFATVHFSVNMKVSSQGNLRRRSPKGTSDNYQTVIHTWIWVL